MVVKGGVRYAASGMSSKPTMLRSSGTRVHIYTLNSVDHMPPLRSGESAQRHGGVAIEAQLPPDSPNQSWLPTPILRLHAEYSATTTWRFGQGLPR
jgi:aldose 1-epimerase